MPLVELVDKVHQELVVLVVVEKIQPTLVTELLDLVILVLVVVEEEVMEVQADLMVVLE
jgi:hypothetical protein|tara:strand:+ start:554 stop:730 length:177 start_codon:yes stop_codon:yes gene_type:complete